MAELQAVLSRSKFYRYASPAQRDAFVSGFIQHAHRVEVVSTVTDCIDPKDNKFLALAEAAGAELLVASDPHLTDMNP